MTRHKVTKAPFSLKSGKSTFCSFKALTSCNTKLPFSAAKPVRKRELLPRERKERKREFWLVSSINLHPFFLKFNHHQPPSSSSFLAAEKEEREKEVWAEVLGRKQEPNQGKEREREVRIFGKEKGRKKSLGDHLGLDLALGD